MSKGTYVGMLAIAGLLLVTVVPAFAHSSRDIDVPGFDNEKIRLTIGHTSEPTSALKEGVHDGKHNVDIIIRDKHTLLPVNTESLTVDRYFWPSTISTADQTLANAEIETGLDVVSGGQPGYFTVRQVVTQPGTYGYRVYGTITYYDGTIVNVDVTKICRAEGGSGTHPLDNPSTGWSGGYGCVEDIEDKYWPPMSGGMSLTLGSDSSPILQTLLIGAPIVAGLYGAKIFRNKKQ